MFLDERLRKSATAIVGDDNGRREPIGTVFFIGKSLNASDEGFIPTTMEATNAEGTHTAQTPGLAYTSDLSNRPPEATLSSSSVALLSGVAAHSGMGVRFRRNRQS
jgi:hypothetical protein